MSDSDAHEANEANAERVDTAWKLLTDVERAALVLLAEDLLSPTDGFDNFDACALDADQISVLYRGVPIHSFASHVDPQISEPCVAALVAIDRAARAIVSPFDMRERISKLDSYGLIAGILQRARESVRAAARASEPLEPLLDVDDDGGEWLPFHYPSRYPNETMTSIPAGACAEMHTNLAEPFDATHLAVTVPESIALACEITLKIGHRYVIGEGGPVSAELYRVRVSEDAERPIERGGRIGPSRSGRESTRQQAIASWPFAVPTPVVYPSVVYPSIPALLFVNNRSSASVDFRAALRGRVLR